MTVLFCLVAMFATSYLTGYALLFGQKANLVHRFRAQIGYSYLLTAFYVLYIYTQDMSSAVIATTLLPAVYFFIRYLLSRFSRNRVAPRINRKTPAGLAIALIAVFALAAWPHIATGWGSYWHSGNYDIEDGLNGRSAYIDNYIFGPKDFSLKETIGDGMKVDFSNKTGTSSIIRRDRPENSYYEWYAGDSVRLQYSNLAFWSYFLKQPYGMDVTIVHSIFNLILMATGLFAMSRCVFNLTENWSAIASFSAVTASFYLGTFWAGHIGSLMYGAVVPMIATFILASNNKADLKSVAPWLALGIGAMAFTYLHALILGLFYWVGYRVYESNAMSRFFASARNILTKGIWFRVLITLLGIVALCLLAYFLWHGTESYRIRQEGQYRAWGLVKDVGILPVFLGYSPNPSGLAGRAIYLALTSIGLISSALLVLCFIFYKGAQKKFIQYFAITWIVGLIFFYTCIQDSYYIYKYLYTHQFMFIVGLCAFVAASGKIIVRFIGCGLLAINVASDVLAANQIYQMPHNGRISEFEQLANFNKNVLKTSFVDLIGGEAIATRQTLKKHKIDTELDARFAEYSIVRKSTGGDITGEQLGEVIFNTELIEVRRNPVNNHLMVRTWFEPETYLADPLLKSNTFRWIGQGKNDNVGIYVIRPDHRTDEEMPFLRICGQKGPSAVGKLSLNISSGDGVKLGELSLEGTNCTWLPSALIKSVVQPLILRTGSMGKKLSPPEDRTLLYRIFSVGWVGKKYDEKAMSWLNPTDPNMVKQGESLRFGNGWWPPESFNGEHFRWASQGAEVIVPPSCKTREAKIVVDFEIGPSHGTNPIEFNAIDFKGKTISQTKSHQIRQRIEFMVTHSGIYRFTTNSQGITIPEDFRLLDFRVFKIELEGC